MKSPRNASSPARSSRALGIHAAAHILSFPWCMCATRRGIPHRWCRWRRNRNVTKNSKDEKEQHRKQHRIEHRREAHEKRTHDDLIAPKEFLGHTNCDPALRLWCGGDTGIGFEPGSSRYTDATFGSRSCSTMGNGSTGRRRPRAGAHPHPLVAVYHSERS